MYKHRLQAKLTALKSNRTSAHISREHRRAVLQQIVLVVNLYATVDIPAVRRIVSRVKILGADARLARVLGLVGLALAVRLAVHFAGSQLSYCVFAWKIKIDKLVL